MPDECRPPVGTPDGVWCWLKRHGPIWIILLWSGGYWHEGRHKHAPGVIGGLWGYRFHSIAEVPHD